jgi:shikimate dehydrogenase
MIRAAVLGSPISHSLSPILHRRAYQFLGISGQYEAFEVEAEELAGFINSLDSSWTGLSLTMPLKEEVLRVADEVEPLAIQISSANTLIRSGNGWKALTTDVNGFRAALSAHGVHEFTRIGILGAGATARAAAAAVDGEGREIFILQRSSHREAGVRRAAPSSELHFMKWGAALPEVELLINTTPYGIADDVLDHPDWVFAGVLFEALYDPWPTLLLAQWRNHDLPTIDGLDLLVSQGIDQVALMTHAPIDRQELTPILRQACLDELLGRAARQT